MSRPTLKARPTTYNGIEMRSRLEARFAAYLDSWGLAWEYEPRAFANKDGQYLPDFRVQFASQSFYFEVKPEIQPFDPTAVLRRMRIIRDSDESAGLAVVTEDGTGWWVWTLSQDRVGRYRFANVALIEMPQLILDARCTIHLPSGEEWDVEAQEVRFYVEAARRTR